jgi:hypothetical protein
VLRQGGEGDPDVAVDVFLAGGTGAGVVVDATAFDMRAVARGGGVVDGQTQASLPEQGFDGQEGGGGHVVGVASDGADGDVTPAEVGGDAGGAEPGGDGASPLGEEDAEQQQRHAGGGALVEPVGQGVEGGGQEGGQV